MKIKIEWEVDSPSGTLSIGLEDINCTQEEWDLKTEEQKESALQGCLDFWNEQPYMIFNGYKVTK